MDKKSKSVRNNHRRLATGGMLQKVENRLDAFVDASVDAFLLFDENLNLVSINPAGERMLGISKEVVEGKNILGFAPEIKKTGRYDKYLNVIKTGDPFFAEDMFPHPRFGDMHLSVKAFKMRKGLGLIVNDITERRRVEEALKHSEKYFRALIENSLEAIVIMNADGTVGYESPSIERVLGYRLGELTGKNAFELVHPDDLPDVTEAVNQLLQHPGMVLKVELRARHKDGSWHNLEVIGNNLSSDPTVAGIVVNFRDITERKGMEEALHESELVATATIEGMSDGVMLVSMDGTVAYINKAFEKILGYKVEELVGTSAVELPTYRSSKDKGKARQALKRVIERGSTEPVDMMALNKDGKEIPISFSASVIKDAHGNPKTLVAVIRDITERRRAEDKVWRSEEYFWALMENSSEGVAVISADGKITYASLSYEHVLGYKPEERVGTGIFEYIYPDDKPKVVERFAEIMQKPGAIVQTEVRAKRKDGSWRYIDAIGKNLLDNPAIGGVVVNIRDITERKQVEEKLKASEKKYRQLVDRMQEGLWVIDKDSYTTFVNPRMAEILGYTVDEMIGKHLFAFMDEHGIEIAKYLLERRQQGIKEQHDFEFMHKNGTRIYASLETSPIIDDQGNYIGALACVADITKRREMEEALRKSEGHFRSLVENALDVITVIDSEGIIRYESPSVERVLGYKLEERIGRDIVGFVHPDDMPSMINAFNQLVQNLDTNMGAEVRAKHKDGSWRTVEARAKNVPDDSAVGAFVLNWRDISERKHAEMELRVSEERYRLVVENASEAIVVAQDGVLKFFNSRAIEILGYSKEEMAFKPFIELIHPDDQQMVAGRHVARLRGEELPSVYSFRVVDKTGNVRWVEISAVMLTWEGRPATLNFLTDITERRDAEEALKRSEEKLRLYLDNSPDAIYISDANATFLYGNKAAERFIGYSQEELIGKSFLELSLLPQEDLLKAARLLELSLAGKPTGPDELELIRKDGSRAFVEISTYPTWEGGKLEIIGIARNITERKRAEEEKRRIEEQLRLAGRLAAVGELAAGVAHELNNPLAAIQGYSQFMTSNSKLDEATKKDVEIIYREALRASKITQNLLSFARRHEPEKGLISLNEVLEKTIELRAHQMEVNNIALAMALATDLPKTMADFYQMQQVFVNIINNAEQAMVEAHKGGKLEVKSEVAGGVIKISFRDDGPGISEENMKRIFDPFFTTKEVGKGTGLGLSICYGIIEAHGGRIYARSKLGEGATFIVELPIVTDGQGSQEV